jgi:hypothetical protein
MGAAPASLSYFVQVHAIVGLERPTNQPVMAVGVFDAALPHAV